MIAPGFSSTPQESRSAGTASEALGRRAPERSTPEGPRSWRERAPSAPFRVSKRRRRRPERATFRSARRSRPSPRPVRPQAGFPALGRSKSPLPRARGRWNSKKFRRQASQVAPPFPPLGRHAPPRLAPRKRARPVTRTCCAILCACEKTTLPGSSIKLRACIHAGRNFRMRPPGLSRNRLPDDAT